VLRSRDKRLETLVGLRSPEERAEALAQLLAAYRSRKKGGPRKVTQDDRELARGCVAEGCTIEAALAEAFARMRPGEHRDPEKRRASPGIQVHEAGWSELNPGSSRDPVSLRLRAAQDVLALLGEQVQAMPQDTEARTLDKARVIACLVGTALKPVEAAGLEACSGHGFWVEAGNTAGSPKMLPGRGFFPVDVFADAGEYIPAALVGESLGAQGL